ncbi:hypothetical protein [Nostoc sp. CHAB 5715]|uniref:hypothetical protein n=1 Tax=Nostoc sp. CHAB 5715 TaxID=2780400 RepID=UPI001E63AF41|nr:hypothetical protein [Nostoc sp. CHAB 5715]MCC5620418.1 hypothetical protein [Nostoc sp. CHAB 5715]
MYRFRCKPRKIKSEKFYLPPLSLSFPRQALSQFLPVAIAAFFANFKKYLGKR